MPRRLSGVGLVAAAFACCLAVHADLAVAVIANRRIHDDHSRAAARVLRLARRPGQQIAVHLVAHLVIDSSRLSQSILGPAHLIADVRHHLALSLSALADSD